SDRDPVEELAEEFVERYRRGERPSLHEYTERYPAEAARIRALFPALVVMEKVRPEPAEGTQAGAPPDAADVRPEQLGDYRLLRRARRGPDLKSGLPEEGSAAAVARSLLTGQFVADAPKGTEAAPSSPGPCPAPSPLPLSPAAGEGEGGGGRRGRQRQWFAHQ